MVANNKSVSGSSSPKRSKGARRAWLRMARPRWR